jgi:hypothetical protein
MESVGVFELLMVFWSGALIVLFGVLLGGILVFRTKREAYEPLFQPKTSGGAVNLDDIVIPEPEEDRDVLPGIVAEQNDRFLRQLYREKETQEAV